MSESRKDPNQPPGDGLRPLQNKAMSQADQLSPEIKEIGKTLENTFTTLFQKIQSDSKDRDVLINSFASVLNQLQSCRQSLDDPTLIAKLEKAQQEAKTLTAKVDSQAKEIEQIKSSLTRQLNEARQESLNLKTQLEQLQAECKEQTALRNGLIDDNRELRTLQVQYQEEITKQSSLLSAIIRKLRDAVSSIRQMGDKTKEKSNILLAAYAGDTMLDRIKTWVLEDKNIGDILEEKDITLEKATPRIQKMVEDEWTNGIVQNTIEQLETIIRTLEDKSLGETTQQSLPLWRRYLEKLREFLSMLKDNITRWVREWILMRKPDIV